MKLAKLSLVPLAIAMCLSGTAFAQNAKKGLVIGFSNSYNGNTFRQSPHVNKEPLVGDMEAGVSFFWSDAWKLDFMALRRTIEFSGQPHPDLLGTAAVSFSW